MMLRCIIRHPCLFRQNNFSPSACRVRQVSLYKAPHMFRVLYFLQPRDPAYVPDTEGVNGRVRYGDIVLVLKKKEVRQEYIMSLLEVKDIEVKTQL